jgi:hypothetical protein
MNTSDEMKTIIINETRLLEEVKKLEEKRDEHYRSSAEYIEIDEQVALILRLVSLCTVA